ncbi:MAG: regulator of PEP synthase PpsR (kinase-PPPase family) [Myxococcota bacterium]|jgi:regulator of PEP synthase PpsR (kinase-PPPase family)
MTPRVNPIFIISDGTGDTAENVVRAALHQFQGYLVHVRAFPNITERDQLERLVRLAAKEDAMLVTTLVRTDMRAAAAELAKHHRVQFTDLIGSLLSQLTMFLETQPEEMPGRMHKADSAYFQRIEAVEFTVKADDGKEPRMLSDADIILVGVSRTSKTPLSVYLAHKGYKVSNVPLVLDRPLPRELKLANTRRVFALTIDPESLQEIRRHRLVTMQVAGRSNYSDMDYILSELDWAEDLYRQNPTWPVIDVTRKAVEETAAIIIKIMNDRGLGKELAGAIREAGQL